MPSIADPVAAQYFHVHLRCNIALGDAVAGSFVVEKDLQAACAKGRDEWLPSLAAGLLARWTKGPLGLCSWHSVKPSFS